MVFNTVIETERLLLRKLSLLDAADMFEYTSKTEVATHLSWSAHTDISQVEAFIMGVLERYNSIQTEYTFGIELKSHKKLIGALKITNISFYNKRGEFTSILNPAFQGKGYMGEAWQGLLNFSFNKGGLNRIQSYVTEDNRASIRKNERAGLSYEGRLKDYWVMKGEYKDALVYAITSETYNKLNEDKK